MAINLDVLLQGAIFGTWAVPVTFVPYVSQPLAGAYPGSGILNTYKVDVAALDGSIYTEQRTILDIRESLFATMPQQGDHVIIPLDCNNVPKGEYEIVSLTSNGGGQTEMFIRMIETMVG